MAIFKFVVVVSIWRSQWRVYHNTIRSSPCRVVNGVHKFIKLLALRLQKKTGLLVAPSWVDVHWDSGMRRNDRTKISEAIQIVNISLLHLFKQQGL
jgi:hypothetical protein